MKTNEKETNEGSECLEASLNSTKGASISETRIITPWYLRIAQSFSHQTAMQVPWFENEEAAWL